MDVPTEPHGGKTGKRAITRARFLDVAAQTLRQSGVEGFGVAGLMARAGLTVGGFYNHFQNRDDLVANAVDRMFEDTKRMRQRHLGKGDPQSDLGALIDDYLSDERLGLIEMSCPMASLGGEASRMRGDARGRFDTGVTAFREALIDAVTALGVGRPEENASYLLSEMVRAMSLARASATDAVARNILRASRRQIKHRLGLDAEAAEGIHHKGELR